MLLGLCHLVLLCECKQLSHHHQVKFTVVQLPGVIQYPLVVIDREDCAARFAVEMLILTAFLGKACDASFLHLCTITDINNNVIVIEGEIT